jgi:hypothetical protein
LLGTKGYVVVVVVVVVSTLPNTNKVGDNLIQYAPMPLLQSRIFYRPNQ